MTITKEELQEMFDSFKTEVLSTVDAKNRGVASSLSKDFKILRDSVVSKETSKETPAIDSEQEEKLTMKSLQQQIKQLQQEKQEQERELQLKNRNEVVRNAFNGKSLLHADKALKAFMLDAEIVSEGSNYFVKNGEEVLPLTEAVDCFLKTEFGQVFLPPSSGKGMNMKPAVGEQNTGYRASPSLNQLLLTDND